MAKNWPLVREIISGILRRKVLKTEAVKRLAVSQRTLRRYLNKAICIGVENLRETRGGNHQKLTPFQKAEIKQKKKEGPWRSARWIKDHLNLPVHEMTVWRVLGELNHLNSEQVKPIVRFEADYPNQLWQTDIMGKIFFPKINKTGCYLYLIATLDDHSRFDLSGGWYHKQSKINVFSIWYQALAHWGLPDGMLQDKGSQYRPTGRTGEADYQYYARLLGIKLIFANHAQTKGKIERFWRFVQRDFVRENINCSTTEELNRKWQEWVFWYNYCFIKKHLGGKTTSERYQSSPRKSDIPLKELLIVEVRRTVTRESTISLFGHIYRVPKGYLKCRIWIKIIGNKVLFEANNKIFWKQKLKV